MLQSLAPLTFITGAIIPLHLTKAFSQVEPVVSFVAVSALPGKSALAVFHVIEEVTFILIAIGPPIFLPLTRSIFDAIGKVTDI